MQIILQVGPEEMDRQTAKIFSDIDKGLRVHRRSDGVNLILEQQSANRYLFLAEEEKRRSATKDSRGQEVDKRRSASKGSKGQEEEKRKTATKGSKVQEEEDLKTSVAKSVKSKSGKRKSIQQLASDSQQLVYDSQIVPDSQMTGKKKRNS